MSWRHKTGFPAKILRQAVVRIKIFRIHGLGIPQEKMAKRLGVDQKTVHNHSGEMPGLAFLLNGKSGVGFCVCSEKRSSSTC